MKSSALLMLLFFAVVFSANAQFITIWDTTVPGGFTSNTQISFSRATAGFFSYSYVKTDDGTVTGSNTINGLAPIITFPQPGRYQVTFNLAFTNIRMGGNGDGKKLLSIEAWGDAVWTDMANAFSGCESLLVNAPDSPNLSAVTSMRQMFENAGAVTGFNFENWNVGNVQDFTSTFASATAFNAPIGTWDMHSATTLDGMFGFTLDFDQDLSSWNVSNVTSMQNMFRESHFNHNINNWNVGNVTNMIGMFSRAYEFNQPLNNWNVSNVIDLDQMFSEASVFNQPLGNWDVSNCNNFAEMFYATVFNQPIGSWDMSSCTATAGMFQDAVAFNQDISSWDMSNNTGLDRMFDGATAFNQDISGWDVHSSFSFFRTFHNAISFNQDLSLWNPITATAFSEMFSGASSFSSNISTWNVANATQMSYMFQNAVSFNSDLSAWDVSKVNSMSFMFQGATIFNKDVTGWDVGTVTTMQSMFQDASAFNQNLASWDVSNVLDMSDIFHNSGLSNDNYDKALIGWAALPLQPSVTIGAQTNTYCAGKDAREDIIADFGWFFFDGGESCPPTASITSFTPTFGVTGTTVTITGTNFDGASGVSFGGVDALLYTVDSPTTITAVVGSGASGDVAVTVSGVTVNKPGFTFLSTALITSFTPTSGLEFTQVTIKGFNFTNVTGVKFGGVDAFWFSVVDPTTIDCIVGNGASGDVTVETNAGNAMLSGFTFLKPVISVRTSDDNTGNPLDATNSEAIDMGSTPVDVRLQKTFSIANTGNYADTFYDVIFSNDLFKVDDQPTVIQPNSFETITISILASKPGKYSSSMQILLDQVTINFNITVEVTVDGIVIYNAVTPNGDGAHDSFKIYNIENFPGNKVVILDRLGNEVFTVNDYDNSNSSKRFEGVSNKGGGRNLTDGTYFYVISANNKKYTGFLLLQR